MAVGARITGSFDQVVIYDTYANMVLTGKGQAACQTQAGNTRYVDITVSGRNPIIAWSSSFHLTLGLVTKSGSQTTFRMWCRPEYQGVQFTYYIFDWPDLLPEGNIGLKVWNASRQLVFDSSRKYFRVKAVVASGGSRGDGSYGSLPPGTYAVTQGTSSYGWSYYQLGGTDPLGNTTWVLTSYAQSAKPESNGCSWSNVSYYSGYQLTASAIPNPSFGANNDGKIIVIDVAGF